MHTIFFRWLMADFLLEWTEKLKEGFPNDELGTSVATTRI